MSHGRLSLGLIFINYMSEVSCQLPDETVRISQLPYLPLYNAHFFSQNEHVKLGVRYTRVHYTRVNTVKAIFLFFF